MAQITTVPSPGQCPRRVWRWLHLARRPRPSEVSTQSKEAVLQHNSCWCFHSASSEKLYQKKKKKKSNYTNQKEAAEVMKCCPLGFCFPMSCFCTLPRASSLAAGWEFPGEGVILSYALRADNSLLLGQAECQLPCQLRCALRVSANDQEGEGEAHAVLRGSLRRSRVLSPEHTVCKSLVRQPLLFSWDS